MADNCKDCVYISNLKDLTDSLQEKLNLQEGRITKLERVSDINITKIDNIFKTLENIQKGIDKIADKLDEYEQRPSKMLYGILGSTLGAVITAIVISGIKYFGK